jgi:hypothetical protein
MKIGLRRGYILIISEPLVRIIGRIGTGSSEAKGMAFFPFVFIRSEEFDVPWVVDHERIHHRQEIETLFVGLAVLSLIEFLYARFVLKKNKMQSYLYTAAEQEAYLNMHDRNYLNERKSWALLKFIKHKRDFEVVGPGQIKLLD